jgi:predicted DNA-binding protein
VQVLFFKTTPDLFNIGGCSMSKEKPESVFVMPVKGKYCEIVFDNRVYKIWKEHPNTLGKLGTQIPYDAAVYFLGKTPPVITVVPMTGEGKVYSPLLPEDIEKIRESQARGFVGGTKNFNISEVPKASVGEDEALKQALDLLSKQTDQNRALQEALEKNEKVLEDMQKRVEGLEAVKTVDQQMGDGTTGGATPGGL